MSSSVLHGESLIFCLYPNTNMFPLLHRVFGFTCFIHNFTHNLENLSPHAIKCIFVGYSRIQKGYKAMILYLKSILSQLILSSLNLSHILIFFASTEQLLLFLYPCMCLLQDRVEKSPSSKLLFVYSCRLKVLFQAHYPLFLHFQLNVLHFCNLHPPLILIFQLLFEMINALVLSILYPMISLPSYSASLLFLFLSFICPVISGVCVSLTEGHG